MEVEESAEERIFPPKLEEKNENVSEEGAIFPPKKLARLLISTQFSSDRKLESPEAQLPVCLEVVDVALKDRKQCHCKLAKCLKLTARYCKCFASGVYCNGCNCDDCHNNLKNEAIRQVAVDIYLRRKPNAFRPKISWSPDGTLNDTNKAKESPTVGKHSFGCQCKKIGCLKRYCECFQANIPCQGCKCTDCKNFGGFRKVRQHEAAPGHSGFFVVSRGRIVQSPLSSRSTYRCLLADALRPQDIRKICSLLVAASESIEVFAGSNITGRIIILGFQNMEC